MTAEGKLCFESISRTLLLTESAEQDSESLTGAAHCTGTAISLQDESMMLKWVQINELNKLNQPVKLIKLNSYLTV